MSGESGEKRLTQRVIEISMLYLSRKTDQHHGIRVQAYPKINREVDESGAVRMDMKSREQR